MSESGYLDHALAAYPSLPRIRVTVKTVCRPVRHRIYSYDVAPSAQAPCRCVMRRTVSVNRLQRPTLHTPRLSSAFPCCSCCLPTVTILFSGREHSLWLSLAMRSRLSASASRLRASSMLRSLRKRRWPRAADDLLSGYSKRQPSSPLRAPKQSIHALRVRRQAGGYPRCV